jgi:hypothetical protein
MTGYMITTGEGHLADATLVQLLDDEPLWPAGARDHLHSCDGCTERLRRLRKAAGLLHDSLVDVVIPDIQLRREARSRRPLVISLPIAAAATFLILASAAAATPSVRNWILGSISRSAAPATVSSAPLIAATPVAAGIVASFAPADTVLVIRVERRQSRGVIELDAAPGDRVSAQAIGGTAAEEMVVLPGELRIANATTSTTDYRIRVPASVRIVRVILSGSEVAVVRNQGNLRRRIELR